MNQQLAITDKYSHNSKGKVHQDKAGPDIIRTVGELLLLAGLIWAVVVVAKALIAALAQIAAFAILIVFVCGGFR